jgi:hypothetical protein
LDAPTGACVASIKNTRQHACDYIAGIVSYGTDSGTLILNKSWKISKQKNRFHLASHGAKLINR